MLQSNNPLDGYKQDHFNLNQYFQKPQAHITVKKNRVKTSTTLTATHVFLQDKQEFEIELYNPTQTTKLAKISINGKLISEAGIVIKPGQRIYLERYIDTPNKFLFETYLVGTSEEVQKAIANNGNIQVDFYDEYTPHYVSAPFFSFTSNSGTSPGILDTFTTSSTDGNPQKINATYTSHLRSKSKETGKVEKGEHSNQSFTNYHGSFNSYVSSTVKIKLLPLSTQPITASDLAVYCTGCGKKLKKEWKFCSNCGKGKE